jgi:hypothetical protein
MRTPAYSGHMHYENISLTKFEDGYTPIVSAYIKYVSAYIIRH